MARVSYVVQENTTFQQKRCRLFSRGSGATGQSDALFLEDRIVLATFPYRPICVRLDLLAAKNNFLEEEDVVFPVDVHLHDHEDVLEDEFSKVDQMMPFPVFNTLLEASHGLCILGSPLSFVDLVGYPFGRFQSLLQFVNVRVIRVRYRLEQGLWNC